MKSLTYYLTLLVIKLKGVKKEFSRSPINYSSLRRNDLPNPGSNFFKKIKVRTFPVDKAEVTELDPPGSCDHLIIFCHGGAFVYGPVNYHWTAAAKLAQKCHSKVWLVNYPKAPEAKIAAISSTIDAVYKKAVEKYSPKNVILAGDSVGGTLMTTLVQRLILAKQELPSLLVLISPVMDASFSNPEIETLEKNDPILSRNGCLSAKQMAAGKMDLKDPVLSPLYGSFINFPPTLLFIAGNDITRPDQELAAQKMQQAKVDLRTYFGKDMPHIWPILPVMEEAKTDFKKIITAIKEQQAKRNPA